MYAGVVMEPQIDIEGGYITYIQTEINGESIGIGYFHLQSNPLKKGQLVKQGQIIGFQGDSGNLKAAIENRKAVSHLHVKVKDLSTGLTRDPREFLGDNMDPNGNIRDKSNCN